MPSRMALQRRDRTVHVVRAGEGLAAVGAHYGVTAEAVARMNRMAADAEVTAGARLEVPARATYVRTPYSDGQVALKQPIRESWQALRAQGGTVRLKPAPGTQVNVDGVTYSGGQSFEPLDDVSALQLIVAGVAIDSSIP